MNQTECTRQWELFEVARRTVTVDFDDPIPVSFLSVRGRFHVVLSTSDDSKNGGEFLSLAQELLKQALADWGIGGKTSSGYGRLTEDSPQRPSHSSPRQHAVGPPPATTSSGKALPRLWELVKAEIVEVKQAGNKTKIFVKHIDTGIEGPIQNVSEMPADTQPKGVVLELFVTISKSTKMGFKYPSNEEKKQAETVRSKAKTESSQNGSPREPPSSLTITAIPASPRAARCSRAETSPIRLPQSSSGQTCVTLFTTKDSRPIAPCRTRCPTPTRLECIFSSRWSRRDVGVRIAGKMIRSRRSDRIAVALFCSRSSTSVEQRATHRCPAQHPDCPSDATLRDLLLGKLSASAAERIEAAFASCTECARRCAALNASDELAAALAGGWKPQSSAGDVTRMLAAGAGASSVRPGELEKTEIGEAEDADAGDSLDGRVIDRGELLEAIRSSRLLTNEQLAELTATRANPAEFEAALRRLVQQGVLTAWQLRQLAKGHTSLLLDNDRYVLLDLIGKGGMGAVYKARHIRMWRDVALKVITPKTGRAEGLVRRFQREVRVTAKLQHEHIVQAFDVSSENDVSFLVLEFVEGSDLSSLVKRDGPMLPAEAAAVCLQAASGLAYAHANGVVHRDVKPHNILLSTSGVTKILDLGLAHSEDPDAGSLSSLTQDGAVMGTIDYMAPEQGSDTHAADPRADVYSLGATLYYLLAGQTPFPGGSAVDKLRRLATEDPQPLGQLRPDLPRELTDVVERMMAKQPAARYQTMEDVVRALRPFAADTIAGRAVVTASVRSAAETVRSPGDSTESDSVPSFAFEGGGSVTTMLRRKTGRDAKQARVLIGGKAGVEADGDFAKRQAGWSDRR